MNKQDMRALRKTLGLTQHQMSAFLRLAPDTVRKYESGAVHPSGRIIMLYEMIRDGDLSPPGVP